MRKFAKKARFARIKPQLLTKYGNSAIIQERKAFGNRRDLMELSELIKCAERHCLHGVMVSQNGRLIAEWHSEPDIRRNVYSAAKSVTAMALGFAVQEGLISLDEKLSAAFPDDMPAEVGRNLADARVRDLMTMCLGQEKAELMGAMRPLYPQDDWVKYALALPFVYKPGSKFVYNNVGPYLAGVLVQRRAGCDMVSYLKPRLFTPLGIKCPMWETDPMGYTFGSGGLFLSLAELHRLGQFCLDRGSCAGKQLLSANWISECTEPQGAQFYGYGFWRGEYNSFRMDGKYSQLSVVMPDTDSVVSLMAESHDSKALLRTVYDTVCSQL